MLLKINYKSSHFQLLSQETSEQKEFVDTLQISVSNADLNITESNSRTCESVVLSVKTEDSTGKQEPLAFSLYNDDNNACEIQRPTKNFKMHVGMVSHKEAGSARLKQRAVKLSHIKKSENQGKQVRKSETASEIPEVKRFKCETCSR
jgi:hypothetical protein